MWAAVGTIYTTIPNAGRIVGVACPTMLAVIGPALTATAINNPNASGFTIDYTSGQVGSIGGIPIYLSPRLTGATLLIMHPAAAEVYDQIVGMLSVTEPSRRRCAGRLHGLLLGAHRRRRRHRQDHQDAMTDKKSAKDDAETKEGSKPQAVENENGEVIDSPTVNAHVVGVLISSGGGDPQSAKTKD